VIITGNINYPSIDVGNIICSMVVARKSYPEICCDYSRKYYLSCDLEYYQSWIAARTYL